MNGLMVEMRAEQKSEEERSRNPWLARLHSVGNFILWTFFVVSILSFIVGCIAGIVLLIRRLL